MRKLWLKIREKGFITCMIYAVSIPIYAIIKRIYLLIVMQKEIDANKILFCSIPSFSDNSKTLYEYLQNSPQTANYHYVWLIEKNDPIPQKNYPNTEFFYYEKSWHRGFSLRALKEISSSKYIFFTHKSPFRSVRKREGQVVINLWHGCGYKDVQSMKTTWIQRHPFDIGLVPGKAFVPAKSKFWGCSEEQIWTLGYPRYDLLRKPSPEAKRYMERTKGEAEKLVMWMPTFRNTGKNLYPEDSIQSQFDLPLLQSMDEMKKLNEFCQERRVKLCLKRHPFQKKYLCEEEEFSNICFISNSDLAENEVDLYTVFQYTDALISDYSSIAIDYLLLNKPIAFALDDFEKYQSTRGFVFEEPLNYMPGHHLYCLQDLCTFVDDVSDGMDRFAEDRETLMPEVHNLCHNYCERVWNAVERFSAGKRA